MLQPHEPAAPDGNDEARGLAELRAEMHRLRVQLVLVEVLYLRLVALQARRLADPAQELTLAPEAARLEAELACARTELERQGSTLTRFRFPDLDPRAN